MEKAFLQILNMSITAGYCALAVMALRLLLKKQPKIYSYALWLIVAFRLVCPVSFESAFSLMRASTETVPTNIATAQVPEVSTGNVQVDVVVNNALAAVAGPTVKVENSVDKTSGTPFQMILFVVSLVWLLVAAGFFGYGIGSYLKMRRELKDAEELEPGVFISGRLKTPFVLGSIRPQIYLPADLSSAEKVYVLEHEHTHIHRGDHIIKQAAFLLLCVYWFHPLLWAGYFLMCKDMEMSCDEKVIKKLSRENTLETKKNYASTLLALASNHQFSFGGPLAFGEGNIKKRISNVLQYKKRTVMVSVLLAAAVLVAALLFMGNPKQEKETGNPVENDFTTAVPTGTMLEQTDIAELELLQEKDGKKMYYGMVSDSRIATEYFTLKIAEEAVNYISYVLTIEEQADGGYLFCNLDFYMEDIMDTHALLLDCIKNGKDSSDIPTWLEGYFWIEMGDYLEQNRLEAFEDWKTWFVLTNESGTGGMVQNVPLDNIFSGSPDTREEAERYGEINSMLNEAEITFHKLPQVIYTPEELEQYESWKDARFGTRIAENVYYGMLKENGGLTTPLCTITVQEDYVNDKVSYLLLLDEKADGTRVVDRIFFYYAPETRLKEKLPENAAGRWSDYDYFEECSWLGCIAWDTLESYKEMVELKVFDWRPRVDTVCIQEIEPYYLQYTAPTGRNLLYVNTEGTGAYFWYSPSDVQYTEDFAEDYQKIEYILKNRMSVWFDTIPDAISAEEVLKQLEGIPVAE